MISDNRASRPGPVLRAGLRPRLALMAPVASLALLAGCAAQAPRSEFQPFDSYAEARQRQVEARQRQAEARQRQAEADAARTHVYTVEPAPGAASAAASGATPGTAPGAAPAAAADDPRQALARGENLIQLGTGQFIDNAAARRAAPGAGPTGEVSFNFEGESLHAVVKAILGDFLQQNYVIAPGVQGNVTFSTAKPLRADQALSILEMLLRWNNTTMVWQDGRYTILPVQQALPGNLAPRTGPLQNMRGYEVRAVPLQYISASEMDKLLKPYAKPEAVISVDKARNMLVLAGSRAELDNYLRTVAVFDVDWLAGMSVGIFNMKQTDAVKTVAELEKVFGEGSNTPMAGMFRFMPLEGINAILVITPQPAYLSRVQEWLERLDIGGNQAGQRLYVYDVKNVKAIDLATTLSDIFGAPAPSRRPSSGGSVAPGLESVEVRTVGADGSVNLPKSAPQEKSAASATASLRAGAGAGAGSADAVGMDAGPVVDAQGGIALASSDEVRVSAVEESNAILVLATAAQWESIQHVIERLDTIPLQVHIEAKILQVALTDKLKYGVQWFFENAIGAPDTGFTAAHHALAQNRRIWGDIAGALPGNGLGWSFIGPNAAAMISALDSVSSVNVLSMPSVVALNNKQASITVGEQIPVSSSFINTGISNNSTQTYVQFRDTGITLNVTPRVNPGGLVFLEIDQTDSVPGNRDSAINGNVPVSQRKIKTEVAVQSGQTVLLGGLIKQTEENASSGVPGLHRIPLLGALFGGKTRDKARQELLVMLTPVVIRNGDDASRLTDEYSQQFRALEPLRKTQAQPQPAQPRAGLQPAPPPPLSAPRPTP